MFYFIKKDIHILPGFSLIEFYYYRTPLAMASIFCISVDIFKRIRMLFITRLKMQPSEIFQLSFAEINYLHKELLDAIEQEERERNKLK